MGIQQPDVVSCAVEFNGKFGSLAGPPNYDRLPRLADWRACEYIIQREDETAPLSAFKTFDVRYHGLGARRDYDDVRILRKEQALVRIDPKAHVHAQLLDHPTVIVGLVAQHFHIAKVRI